MNGEEESTSVKMAMLPKAICSFNAIPVKIPLTFFTELEMYTEPQETPNSRSHPEKGEQKDKVGGIMPPDDLLQVHSNWSSMVLA